MKICIYGAGAIGGYLGVQLARAGADVSLIARGAHLAAMRERGLTLLAGEEKHTVHPRCTDNPAELGVQDYIIITLKAHSITGVIETMHGPERLHPLYALSGAILGPEAVIDSLPGYAGSRPVRVGNAANVQVQLDVFGPVVQLICDLSHRRVADGVAAALTDADWNLVSEMVFAVESRWVEPDHGIWEIRGNPRHHVYSKVMCWLTVDRALKLAKEFGREAPPGWATLRDAISAQVRERGWNDGVRSFTAAYDGTDLDAATLHIGLSGLIDPSDERFAATVVATEAELRSGATVYRYHRDDGLPGTEGGFHLCAAWLLEAYLLTDQRSQAEALFDRLVAAAGPTGLLSEEYDPVAERALGNHPQAYSHIGLLRCAQLLNA